MLEKFRWCDLQPGDIVTHVDLFQSIVRGHPTVVISSVYNDDRWSILGLRRNGKVISLYRSSLASDYAHVCEQLRRIVVPLRALG